MNTVENAANCFFRYMFYSFRFILECKDIQIIIISNNDHVANWENVLFCTAAGLKSRASYFVTQFILC